MANEKNLKPLSTSKAREIGSKGGKASVQSKKLKKASRERMLDLLNSACDNKGVLKMLGKKSGKDMDNHEALIVSLFLNAIYKGDAKLYDRIFNLIGENEADGNEMLTKLIEGLKNG